MPGPGPSGLFPRLSVVAVHRVPVMTVHRMTDSAVVQPVAGMVMTIVPVMTAVTRGASLRTLFHPQEEMMCRRAAAYILALSADGIPVLTLLLKEGDLWERQTSIFALDDLTETSNYPGGSIPAMKELIPEIAKATKAKDRVLSEMADEVLGQITRGANTELSSLAKKYIGNP